MKEPLTPHNEKTSPEPTRRKFIKTATATSALAGVSIPHVHAQDSATIQIALVGCGGRGSGAANQALNVPNAPTKLVAMADVFPKKLERSHRALAGEWEDEPDKVEVPEDHRFIGFTAYKDAMDALKPGDLVILATPPAFRWVHYKYAIERGLHVFMEKPVTVDAPTSVRMLELAKQASDKNLKCGVGLMVRHCRGRHELFKRIQDGEIGDIQFMRGYRMHGPVASAFSKRKPESQSEVMYQIDRFHSFLWASGGLFSDFYIHQIDETCWMKDKWPVKAHAVAGRHYRGDFVDQNFDNYSVEYPFDDGSKLFFDGRTMNGAHSDSSSHVHGTKGCAIVSTAGHTPGKVRTFKGQNMTRENLIWAYPQPEKNPYQLEWDDLVEAIVRDKPYNEVPRGVRASQVTSMGRMAAHTGMEITWEQFEKHSHEFAPEIATMTPDGDAPIVADASGRYPIPQPGKVKDREY